MANKTLSYSQTKGNSRGYYDLLGQRGANDTGNKKLRKKVSKSVYSIPVDETVSFGKWINHTEDDIIAKVVQVEVEGYPLKVPEGSGRVSTYKVVLQTKNASLVHIVIFPGELQIEAPQSVESYRGFFPSISSITPPKESIALWLEDGKWVCGFSRNHNWVHVCTLGYATNRKSITNDLQRIYAEQLLKELVPEYRSIEVWATEDPAMRQELECIAEEVTFGNRPRIHDPSEYEIIPHSVADARIEKRKKARRRMWIFLCLVCFSLAGTAMAADLKMKTQRNDSVTSRLAQMQPEAAEISGIHAKWNSLGGAATPARSPVEVLFLLSKVAGPKGIRFESFEMKDESVVMFKVQASSIREATAFESNLESSSQLSHFDWKFSSPKTSRNLVSFECHGRLIELND